MNQQQITDAKDFIESIAVLSQRKNALPALSAWRSQAIEQLRSLGIPSTKDEHWKYTNLQTLVRHSASEAGATPAPSLESIRPYLIPGLDAHRIVFCNGKFLPELSDLKELPVGARVASLQELLQQDDPELSKLVHAELGKLADASKHPLAALNSAILQDGLFFVVGDNIQVTKPVHAVFLSMATNDNAVIPVRNIVLIGNNAQAKLIESYVGLSNKRTFSTSVTELSCGERANFEHTKIQQESQFTTHVGLLYIEQKSHSVLNCNNFAFGGLTVRNEITPTLDGEHIESLLHGLTAISGTQHVDNTTVIDHAKPNSFSRELYKGIYRDSASGAFSGTIIVRPDAQKTNAIQSNQSLLLSPEASIDTRPQLKIYADDVKCTHGATVGQLDDDGLFYIRSRGIDRATAQGMLIHAFACDIINYVSLPAVRQYLETALLAAIR